jgi:hypothetical protein
MGLERERERSRAFVFQKKNTKQTITHPLFMCVFSTLLLYSFHAQRIFVTPSICMSKQHRNCSIWLMNEENIGSCLTIGTCLVMSDSTLFGFINGGYLSLILRTAQHWYPFVN